MGLSMTEQLTITDTARALREYGVRLTYQQIWRAVVAGDIPAKRIGKKWMVAQSDLPSIAQQLAARA